MKPNPERHGEIWSKAEVAALKWGVEQGWDLTHIAGKHKRSVYAIVCAMEKHNIEGWEAAKSGSYTARSITPPSELIINGTNYEHLLRQVRVFIHQKIDILAGLPLCK